MHKTLERQIKKYLQQDPSTLKGWDALAQAISNTYAGFDEDRRLTERSLEISSRELKEAEIRFRQATENANEWIWEINQDGLYTYSSHPIEKIIGYKPEEVVGKKYFYDFFPPDIRETMKEEVLEGIGQRRVFKNYINHLVHKDGRRVIIETNAIPYADTHGNFCGYRGANRDITERKHIEEALQESQAYLKSIFELMQAGVMLVDYETHRIVDCNPMVAKIFGLPREEMIGKTCHNFICPTEKNNCPITDLHQRMDRVERIMFRANGEKIPVLKSVVPLTLKNHRYLLEEFIDLTEQKKIEEELNHSREMLIQADKLNAVGRLASGVAHEVRNPLGIILQSVNYLENNPGTAGEKGSQIIAIIKDNIKRADKIVDSLLNFSRESKSKLVPEEINAILETSLSLIKLRLKFENISVVMETSENLPKILVDRNKLEQVFINILLNAVQAMPDGGKITIRSYRKRLNAKTDELNEFFRDGEEAVVAEVEDTGIGIPAPNLKKIFEPFFTTKGVTGTGLGLTVSQSIIASHHGQITVDSQVNKGTKMTVILKTAPLPPEI